MSPSSTSSTPFRLFTYALGDLGHPWPHLSAPAYPRRKYRTAASSLATPFPICQGATLRGTLVLVMGSTRARRCLVRVVVAAAAVAAVVVTALSGGRGGGGVAAHSSLISPIEATYVNACRIGGQNHFRDSRCPGPCPRGRLRDGLSVPSYERGQTVNISYFHVSVLGLHGEWAGGGGEGREEGRRGRLGSAVWRNADNGSPRARC